MIELLAGWDPGIFALGAATGIFGCMVVAFLAWLVRFEFDKRLDQRVESLREDIWQELKQRIHDDRLVDDPNDEVES